MFSCLILLQQMAGKVKQGEMLVLLLIGHGDVKNGEFQLVVLTQPDKIVAEAFISKGGLENVLESCKGDVLVICNSCYLGLLVSDHWTLLCAAAPDQLADALVQSGSGYVRGSAFTACLVAQAAHEHGLQVPLPRADLRTTDSEDLGLCPLPPSAPSHSFPAQFSTLKPLNTGMSLKEFVGHMQDIEKLHVAQSANHFQTSGLNSTVNWTRILPIEFSSEVVGQIGVKVDSANFVTRYNEIFKGSQGGPLLTLDSRTLQLDPLLIKLATAMPDIEQVLPGTREIIYAQICADVRRYIAEPQRFASPFKCHMIHEDSLLLILRAMHVPNRSLGRCAGAMPMWCPSFRGKSQTRTLAR